MDTTGVETVDFNALGGADTVTVNDLTGTDVKSVNVDLGAGDGQADSVIVNGTNGNDADQASAGSNGSAGVTGLAAAVNVSNAEPANDTLTVNALARRRHASTPPGSPRAPSSWSSMVAPETTAIAGGAGNDKLLGGDGNDSIDGNGGSDTALLGAGDDTFVWDPGDGSDTSRARTAATRCCSTAPPAPSTSTCRRTGTG